MIVRKQIPKLDYYFNCNLRNYWKLSVEDKVRVKRETIDYIFKFKSSYAYRDFLKSVSGCRDSSMKIQRGLLYNGFIMKDLKIRLLQEVCGYTKKLDVGKDANLVRYLTEDQLKSLKRFSKNDVPLDKENLDNLLVMCVEKSRVMASKLIYRKCSFIINNSGVSFNDIKDFVVLESIQNLLFTYPRFKSELHAINTTKTIVRNTTLNFIESFTRKKVNPFSEGVFRIQNLVTDNKEGESYEIHIPSSDFSEDQLRIDFQKLSSKYKGKKLQCFYLISGCYCADFSKFLREAKGLTLDNDLYFEKVQFDYYLKMCSEFLGVDLKHVIKFVDDLKGNFANYRN